METVVSEAMKVQMAGKRIRIFFLKLQEPFKGRDIREILIS